MNRLTPQLWLLVALAVLAGAARAGVLPEDRTDALYHYYNGDNVEIDGPSLLVRKNIKETVSFFGNSQTNKCPRLSSTNFNCGSSQYRSRGLVLLGSSFSIRTNLPRRGIFTPWRNREIA